MTFEIMYGDGYFFDGVEGEFTWADTDDIDYFCSWHCMHDVLVGVVPLDVPTVPDAGEWVSKEPLKYTDGTSTDKYPAVTWCRVIGAETDYDVYCASCEDKLLSGLTSDDDDDNDNDIKAGFES